MSYINSYNGIHVSLINHHFQDLIYAKSQKNNFSNN
nr:MAG TPA: hypothetical protein [Caudoviricetes sp.]